MTAASTPPNRTPKNSPEICMYFGKANGWTHGSSELRQRRVRLLLGDLEEVFVVPSNHIVRCRCHTRTRPGFANRKPTPHATVIFSPPLTPVPRYTFRLSLYIRHTAHCTCPRYVLVYVKFYHQNTYLPLARSRPSGTFLFSEPTNMERDRPLERVKK